MSELATERRVGRRGEHMHMQAAHSAIPARTSTGASKRVAAWFAVPIFLLLFASAVKDDLDIFSQSRFWTGMQLSWVSMLIKQNSAFIYAALLASTVLALILNRSLYVFFARTPLCFTFLYFYASVICSFEDPWLAGRFLASSAIMLALVVLLSSAAARQRNVADIVREGIFAFAVALVLLNVWEFLSGNGFVPGFPRYFGTSGHPNFIGVQMAVCAIAIWYGFAPRSAVSHVVKVALFISAIALLYYSGSRTALVVFISGFALSFTLSNRLGLSALLAIVALTVVAFLFAYGTLDGLLGANVYNRGSADTRTQAWSALMESALQSPFVGHGRLPEYAENSWLRGWATVGIAYPLLLAVVVAVFSVRLLRSAGSPQLKEVAGLCGIFGGLTVGSILEGYLVDAHSLAVWAWFLTLTAVTLHLSLSSNRAPKLRLSAPRRLHLAHRGSELSSKHAS